MPSTSFLDYYRSGEGQRFLMRHSSCLIAAAIVLLILFGTTDLDHRLASLFFDDARRTFPLTNHWLLKDVLHDQARSVSVLGALALLCATALAWLAPIRLPGLHARRGEIGFISLALFTAAVFVGMLKHFSGHPCPWDLAEFGHSLARSALFLSASSPPSIRGCWPAAHPVVGYAWMTVAIAFYPTARRRAWQLWVIAFALGSAFGLVQMARGAHFLSHVLWAAWGVWAVNMALLMLCCWAPKPWASAVDRRRPVSLGPQSNLVVKPRREPPGRQSYRR